NYWNGITCLQYAKVIETIIEKNLFWVGVRHIFSNIVTKYELIGIINDVYQLNIKINKLETQKVDKTLASNFDMGISVDSLEKQIKELKNYKPFLLGLS